MEILRPQMIQGYRQTFLKFLTWGVLLVHLIALFLMFQPPLPQWEYFVVLTFFIIALATSAILSALRQYQTAAIIFCLIFNIDLLVGLAINSPEGTVFVTTIFVIGLTQVVLISGMLLGSQAIAISGLINTFLVVLITGLLRPDDADFYSRIFLFGGALFLSALAFWLYQRSLDRTLFANEELLRQVQEQAAVLATQNEQLRKLNTEQERFLITLEEKVVERTAELQETIGELNTFSSTVAHDLKTPLGGIIGYGEMLHEELEGSAQAQEQAHLADRIVQIAFRMREIIDSLLLLARTRGAEVQTAPMAMYDVVQSACDRLSYVILHNEVQIHMAAEWPLALGNKAWVEEVWANYLSNAIKYGGKPAIIHVGGEILPETAEARFWVQDNGRGLTPAEQEKLFVPFSQLRQAKDSHGLGLAIVKRITTKLGGEVGVESTVGEGSRFYFTLPLAEELVRN